MIRELLGRGEVAVIGLGRSGQAVSRLLAREGARVYASDGSSDAAVAAVANSLNALGIATTAGAHDLERIARAVLVVTSPGVSPKAPPLVTAAAHGVPIVSEVEVALSFLPTTRCIAVTGTNGKTTVTALIEQLLRSLGVDAVAAGNIGTPLSEVALRAAPPAWVALELSSFQLHDTPSLAPAVGVLTNLAPDHLDRYDAIDDYYADKMRLFARATPASRWVVNGDDAEVMRRTAGIAGTRYTFSLRPGTLGIGGTAGTASGGNLVPSAAPAVHADRWTVLGHDLLSRADIPLLGDHNVANVLAAVLAVAVADPAHATPDALARLVSGVRAFRGMPHRLEIVAERDGVLWINDSKATNVASTRVALDGMTRPTVVLLGGRHKGEPYTGLLDGLSRHARAVIAYGESAALIAADLGGHVPLERIESSFEDVMRRARALAQPGDAVLLSPACSSFDMFTNYEERGAEFRRRVTSV